MDKVQTYFEFLRYSLSIDAEMPASVDNMDWQGLFLFAKEQALLGLFFDGVRKLPKEKAPDAPLLMQWYGIADKIEKQNKRVNAIAVELHRILREDGWRYSILKGQGNTLLYSNPYTRTPGDIDIWMFSRNGEMPSREQIVEYVNQRYSDCNTRYYHTEFEYKGIAIEMHFMPGIINSPWHNKRLQKWYRSMGDLQCSNIVSLPDGAGKNAIPLPTFNIIQQLAHIYHHFFDEGVGMRQIVDYYYQLRTFMLQANEQNIAYYQGLLKNFGLYKFAGAMMWVLHETLGIEQNQMLVPMDEKRGMVLLDEILNGGNFGRYDRKYGDLTHQSTAKKFFTKARRSLMFVKLYPSEALCEPVFRLWHYVWRLRHQTN